MFFKWTVNFGRLPICIVQLHLLLSHFNGYWNCVNFFYFWINYKKIQCTFTYFATWTMYKKFDDLDIKLSVYFHLVYSLKSKLIPLTIDDVTLLDHTYLPTWHDTSNSFTFSFRSVTKGVTIVRLPQTVARV